jgi:hypothetical protein
MIGLDAIQGKQGGTPNIPSNKLTSGSDFQSLFAEAGIDGSSSKTGQTATSAVAPVATSTSFASAASKLHDALVAFEKEAHKTPAERAHDQILSKHQLTEDGYKALPPDQKREIDQEIVERTRLLMKNGQTAGEEASDTVSAGASLS